MKVVCINKGKIKSLSINKVYDVIKISGKHIRVMDDNSYSKSFVKRRFISLEDYREKQLNKIL